MPEANKAFAELKQFLTTPLVMTTPQAGKTLLIYIAATNRVLSTAIALNKKKLGMPIKFNALSTSSMKS